MTLASDDALEAFEEALRGLPDAPPSASGGPSALETQLSALGEALESANERWQGTLTALRLELGRLSGRLAISGGGDPALCELSQRLVDRGADPAVAKALVKRARLRVTPASGLALAREPDLSAEIERSVRVAPALWTRSQRTVAALVGASGVGKSRLAVAIAERALERGLEVGLVGAGTRFPAELVARARGRGVPIHLVDDNLGLGLALDALSSARLVLVDTPGASPWSGPDRARVAQLVAHHDVRTHLVLPAASAPLDLPEVVSAWAEEGLAGVCVSKLDEARGIGTLLNVAAASRTPLVHVATGDAVEAVVPAVVASQLTR